MGNSGSHNSSAITNYWLFKYTEKVIYNNESEYKERDRKLNKQFINVINDYDMMTEILRDVTMIKILMK